MQVTVEVCVKPKPRAQRAIVFGPIVFSESGNSAAAEHPARTASFTVGLHKRISCESAPRFQSRSNACVVTDNGDQITWPATAQSADQIGQQPRRERLRPDIQLGGSLHRDSCIFIA